MKKIILPLIAAAFISGVIVNSVEAAEGEYLYGAAGCGLGSKWFGDKPGFIQVLAGTTNGTSYNQSFGISSGTSNCLYDARTSTAFKQQKQEVFVHVNFDSLEHEMAVGKGEKLAAFANLMGCPASHLEEFGSLVKQQHARFFTDREDPTSMLKEVRASIAADKNLARACKI